jgi:hypothetical protein
MNFFCFFSYIRDQPILFFVKAIFSRNKKRYFLFSGFVEMETTVAKIALAVRARTESQNQQQQLLAEMVQAADFVNYADRVMQDRHLVKIYFDEKEFTKDMGLGTTDKELGGEWHFLYHRYNVSFKGYFLSFLQNTPTYRDMVLMKLNKLWCGEDTSEQDNDSKRVCLYELETLGHLSSGVIADNRTVREWMLLASQNREKALSQLYLAMAHLLHEASLTCYNL